MVVVAVPGVQPATYATVMMRAYNGQSWETSTIRGESSLITVPTSGGTLPPKYLVGLQGFSVYPVPEPSTVPLVALFGIALFRRKPKSASEG
jgi:hypothetical protein